MTRALATCLVVVGLTVSCDTSGGAQTSLRVATNAEKLIAEQRPTSQAQEIPLSEVQLLFDDSAGLGTFALIDADRPSRERPDRIIRGSWNDSGSGLLLLKDSGALSGRVRTFAPLPSPPEQCFAVALTSTGLYSVCLDTGYAELITPDLPEEFQYVLVRDASQLTGAKVGPATFAVFVSNLPPHELQASPRFAKMVGFIDYDGDGERFELMSNRD